MNHIPARIMLCAAITITPMVLTPRANAATFRVTSKIFEGADRDPSAEHRILFDEGRVYDLPQIESREVVVYDLPQNRVTLLNRETQEQLTLKTEDLVEATAQARAAAKTGNHEQRLGLTACVESSNRVIGLSIRYGNSEYHTTTQTPGDPTFAVDYGQFADLALRLNILRRRGVPPPFARMKLNDQITTAGELPLETTLTLHDGKITKEYRSTHTLEKLNAADREKIDEVRGMLVLYRKVGLTEFP